MRVPASYFPLRGAGSLAGYFARAYLVNDELQQREFRIRDADDQASVFVRVKSRQRDRAFAVDQAGNVSGSFAEFTGLSVRRRG